MKIVIKRVRITPLDILAVWVMYFFSYCTIDFFKNSTVNLLGYASFVIFFIICTIVNKSYLIRFIKVGKGIILFWVIIFLASFFNTTMPGLNEYARNIIYMIIYLSLYIYFSEENKKSIRCIVLIIWFIDSAIININTIKSLIENPLLSRLMSTGNVYDYVSESISVVGVATFGAIYGLVLVADSLFYLILLKNLKIGWMSKILMLAYAILSIFTIIQAQFTIALLLLLVGIGLVIWMLPSSKKKKEIKYLVIIFGVLLILLFIDPIISTIINSGMFSETINIRLEEVKNFLTLSSGAVTDLGARFKLYSQSLSTFFESFGLGIILVGKGEVGGHSEILDGFANFGILLFPLIICFFVVFYKEVNNKIEVSLKNGWKTICILFIFEALLNTAFWARQIETILLIIPLLFLSYSKVKIKRKIDKEGENRRYESMCN